MNQRIEFPDFLSQLSTDHPVKVYYEENNHLKNLLGEITQSDPKQDPQKFFNLFNQLCEVEKRYARKENQLFPFLEKRGWNGPSQGMWAFHDSNRSLIKNVRKNIEEHQFEKLPEAVAQMVSELSRMILVEEQRLFPTSLQILTDEDWKEMQAGESEIGWMHKKAQPDNVELGVPPSVTPDISGLLKMSEGIMSLQQINLLLQFVPFDLTYVDENDKVIFYNRGAERVFPRSAGIIGREVRFCHPPKSVGTVLKILEEFKNGNQDQAEFWIQFKGRVIHIRYFAIRDGQKQYKGVIEVSQDITEIQKLQGERRLLNWS
jgi:PAS domain S-box-containing protein